MVKASRNNDILNFICTKCNMVIHVAHAAETGYENTYACEEFETQLWREHAKECKEIQKEAEKMAQIARDFGHEAEPEDFL